MFFRRRDDIYDDDYEDKKIDLSKYKLPLIILGGIILLIVIIFIISKFINKNGIVYEDKLYYITLEGDANITLYVGDKYNEPGYSGKDDEGNDLTNEIVVINNIDTSVVGNYKVSYTLGNVTKDRIVKVIEKPVGATKIYLYGDMNVFLYVGEKYVEKYYEVVDTVDGAKLKDKVTIKSNVDTSKEGIYKVIYSVVNSSGVTTTEERTVIVMDRELSLIPNTTDITNNNITINVYTKDEFFDYLILPNGNKTTERTTTYEVSSNGTYKFVAYNNKGESKEKSITISNIDKESPTGSCSGYYQNGTSQINILAKDNVGISRYEINGTSYTINTIKINNELTSANVIIYDKAGNSKSISCNLENKNPNSQPPSGSSTEITKLNVSAGTYERDDYDSEMRYVEIMPSDATTNMPLVIFLDGIWRYSTFPDSVLGYSVTKYVQNGNAYNEVGEKFLYIAPRCVVANGTNGGVNWYGSDGISEGKKLVGLIDHLYNKYKIDKSRIYITGVSLGGDGVWYMINANPNLFAAGTAVSGCAFGANASNFITTPVLGYNGTGETEVNYAYTTCVPDMIRSIKKAGGIAESRVKRGWDHGNMINVYSTDKDVFKWMFKYKRS